MSYRRDLLIQELEFDEGRRQRAYTDPRGKVTIGVGRNLTDVGMSDPEIDALRDADIAVCEAELDRALPWWRRLSDNRQRVLLNMQFNLGWPKLSQFKRMIDAARAEDFPRAATEMRNSIWATQVGDRAIRLARLMEHG